MKKLYRAGVSVERDFSGVSDFTIQFYEYPIVKEEPEYYVILRDNHEFIIFKNSKEPSAFPTKLQALEALSDSLREKILKKEESIRQLNLILQQLYIKIEKRDSWKGKRQWVKKQK